MARRRRRTQDRSNPNQQGIYALRYAERRRQDALARAEAAALDGDRITQEYALQEADHWFRMMNAARESA